MQNIPYDTKLRRLRVALLANAAFSLATGSALVLFAIEIAGLIGAKVSPLLLTDIGWSLLPFGVFVAWLGTRRQPNLFAALAVSIADLLWVACSAALLVFASNHFSVAGAVITAAVAAIVLGFALGQLRGIACAFSDGSGDRSRFRLCFDIRSEASPDQIWRNVADFGNIARFAPMLSESGLRDNRDPSVGAIRDCTDRASRRWSERCTVLDHDRRELAVEFLADEPGFPFPFSTMTGGWTVRAAHGGAVVRIWWEGAQKFPRLGPVVLPLFVWQARRQFPAMVQRMSGRSEPNGEPSTRLAIAPC